MKKERNSNFELMRIISMLFIVIYHIIIHGHVLENCHNEGVKIIIEFIKFFIIVHVNSFILTTGYFQSKSTFKQSKIWKLFNASLFYRIIFFLILVPTGYVVTTNLTILRELSPIDTVEYWFIKIYIMLYILSPFINKAIDTFDKKTFINIIGVLFILEAVLPSISGGLIFDNNGYTLYHFIFMYLVGAYFRKYPLKESSIMKSYTKQSLRILLVLLFFGSLAINFTLYKSRLSFEHVNFIFDEIANHIGYASNIYNNPLIIIQSVSYFLLFETFDFKNKFINRVSSLVMGVYFIHDNNFVREVLYKKLLIEGKWIFSYRFILYILFVAILIYVSCLIIEFVRQLLFKFIYDRKVSTKIREKYYTYLDSLKP